MPPGVAIVAARSEKKNNRLHPLWIVNSKKARKDDAARRQWSIIQPLVETMGRLFSVEIVIINAAAVCVAGTGPYADGLGLVVPKDTALAHSLSSGESVLMLDPRESSACNDCSLRRDCLDQANYSGPVLVDNKAVAAVQIVAFDTQQRGAVLEWAESTFLLVRQLIEQLCRAGVIQAASSPTPQEGEDCLRMLVGNSPAMHQLRERIRKAAALESPVLVQGESGTGKELVARAVHACSPRRDAPFVPVNCGALPESLIESELFGYSGGAFSGASQQGKSGLWEHAAGGTLFLDEVAELPLALQVKLLRTLQDGVIRRVGGKDFVRVDTRVIAATNKNLQQLVAAGTFRLDLFYRLNVIPITVPPLRERKEDIRILVSHFIEEFCAQGPRRIVRADPMLLRRFEAHDWPGNVREVKNCIEYGINFSEDSTITWEILADHFGHLEQVQNGVQEGDGVRKKARRSVPLSAVQQALAFHGDTLEGKRKAAASLGISIATLYRILQDAVD